MIVDSKGYNILFFKFYRPIVLFRDKYQCKFCGLLSISNHVHHIDGNKESSDIENMVTLCSAHHNAANSHKLKFNKIDSKNVVVDLVSLKRLVENGTVYF